MRKFKQGIYNPINPEKWKPDGAKIVYRSSYEYKFNKWADLNKDVLLVASERVVIPYYWEVDKKMHKYYVDYMIRVRTADGTLKNFLIEIKPHAQTVPPKRGGRKKKETYLNEMKTFSKNDAKWKAARIWCREHDMEFKIITEKHLFK